MAGRAGGTAIEFAIVGSVFLLFVCMILENGIILFTQASLDNATRDAARLIMIGSAQGSNSSVFSTQLCNDLSNFITCSNLAYHVQAGATFASLNPTVTTSAAGAMTSTGFNGGSAGQDVLVEVGYARTYFITWIGNIVSSNDSLLLISTVAFQNEP
jgi:Flp pilus assembly protein TadG